MKARALALLCGLGAVLGPIPDLGAQVPDCSWCLPLWGQSAEIVPEEPFVETFDLSKGKAYYFWIDADPQPDLDIDGPVSPPKCTRAGREQMCTFDALDEGAAKITLTAEEEPIQALMSFGFDTRG